MHSTGWKFSPPEDGLYERKSGDWFRLSPVLERRGRNAYRRHNRAGIKGTPSIDSVPTMHIGSKSRVATTGCSPYINTCKAKNPESAQEFMHSSPPASAWATSKVNMDNDGTYMQ
eukprot:4543799-Ditylum_brightwellii.AAC.1